MSATLAVEVVVCHRNAEFSNPEAFAAPSDPVGNASIAELRSGGARCTDPKVFIDDAHVHSAELQPTPFPGVNGYFAYAQLVRCGPTE